MAAVNKLSLNPQQNRTPNDRDIVTNLVYATGNKSMRPVIDFLLGKIQALEARVAELESART